jgi:hypothetical protein
MCDTTKEVCINDAQQQLAKRGELYYRATEISKKLKEIDTLKQKYTEREQQLENLQGAYPKVNYRATISLFLLCILCISIGFLYRNRYIDNNGRVIECSPIMFYLYYRLLPPGHTDSSKGEREQYAKESGALYWISLLVVSCAFVYVIVELLRR